MRATGIVVEYNPFHNGHLYHVEQAKKIAHADVVVAVMSGSFLQRGEPAVVDKWTRTKMALHAGVDIVIELPYAYSTAQARQFASGSISLLHAIGCESVVFGSENGDIAPFLHTHHLISTYRIEYEKAIHEAMQQGLSYPKALQHAYQHVLTYATEPTVDLAQPNNILGYHYVEAAHELAIRPLTIPRIAAHYHDEQMAHDTIASATAIRKALFDTKNLRDIEAFVPTSTYEALTDWQAHSDFIHWQSFWPLLQHTILQKTPQQLTQYVDVSEGIEHAFIKAAKTSTSFAEFMQKVKSKRYTWTRLQRMLTHIFTGYTKELHATFTEPRYIRLLGITKSGQAFISQQKKSIPLPLISRVASSDDAMLKFDLQAANLYDVAANMTRTAPRLNVDYRMPPIRI